MSRGSAVRPAVGAPVIAALAFAAMAFAAGSLPAFQAAAQGACAPGIVAAVGLAAPGCLKPLDAFRDCPDICPEMAVVPAGTFSMGSPAAENARFEDEGPAHRVTIAAPFAIGRTEVTRGEFAAFLAASGHRLAGSCFTNDGVAYTRSAGKSYRDPGYPQDDRHPAVCLRWEDAKAYAAWLSALTGKAYRLPSEAEWEYAARAGTASPTAFDPARQCAHANASDQTAVTQFPRWMAAPCRDGYVHTAPAGSFAANPFGLYDMAGNAWEWTEDCYNPGYEGAPADGAAWTVGACAERVLRGSSWDNTPNVLRSALRFAQPGENPVANAGFRLARSLAP